MAGNFDISYIFKAIDKLSPVAQKISKSFSNVGASVTKVNSKLDNFNKKIRKSTDAISSFGRRAFLKMTLPIGLLIGSAIKLRAEMEDTEIVFKTMLGSAEKAGKMIGDIRDLAAKTPFGEQELFRAAKLMLNFGLAADKIIPTMTMLGDVSGGNKDRFQRLSLAFAQVQSVGRLMGQDLLQMVNAGFNPLQVISEETGISMRILKDEMSKGNISFRQVSKAFEIATSKGGKFFNLMEARSKTTSGRFSTLLDTIKIELTEVGKILEPTVKKILELLLRMTEAFSKLSPKTKKFLLIIGAILAILPILAISLGSIIFVIGALTPAIIALSVAMGFLALNPIGLLITGIGFLLIYSEKFREVFVAALLKIRDIAMEIARGIMDNFIKPFLSFIGKITDFVSKVLGKDLLGKEKLNITVTKVSEIRQTGTNLGLTGNINISGAPAGSTAEFETSGAPFSNLGVNMASAGGGI